MARSSQDLTQIIVFASFLYVFCVQNFIPNQLSKFNIGSMLISICTVGGGYIGLLSSSMFAGMMFGAVGWGTCKDLFCMNVRGRG